MKWSKLYLAVALGAIMQLSAAGYGADLAGSLSLRTPRRGRSIDWEAGIELEDSGQAIRLVWEREDGRHERGREIRISAPAGPLTLGGQETVNTVRNIDEQKVSLLWKGRLFAAGAACSWLAWEKPKALFDLQAHWERDIASPAGMKVQVQAGCATDFGKRRTMEARLRLRYPIGRKVSAGGFLSYFRNAQSENVQLKALLGIAL